MDEAKKAEIRATLDTPIGALTARQAIAISEFMDDATDEDLADVGLTPKARDL